MKRFKRKTYKPESIYHITMKTLFWIQKAIKKPGSLHKQLKIPEDKKIPMALLKKIVAAKAGDEITFNRERIKVTRLMEQRAIAAINLKNISKKKR